MTLRTTDCRICGGDVTEFLDLGPQPLSDSFRRPDEPDDRFRYNLVIGCCSACEMVQLLEEVPRERMFHAGYPYRSSGSVRMREHFKGFARRLLQDELGGQDSFVIEVGCNDGVMLRHLAEAGVRHLGVEPSSGVAELARQQGVSVLTEFFDEDSARKIAASDGRADVVYAANTFCHIPYVDSIFRGLDVVLHDDGLFVFEDPYLDDVLAQTAFDQIYDEHFYLFSATSVAAMAERYGFELIDVERLSVHGGEVRYTLSRPGRRPGSDRVVAMLRKEAVSGLSEPSSLQRFSARVHETRDELRELLFRLREEGRQIVGYGATAKSATVTNFCGLGPELVEFTCDATPEKQGRLTPGSNIPIFGPERFRARYPDYALLFAWNHAEEIRAKEHAFEEAGGRWIHYIPRVHVR